MHMTDALINPAVGGMMWAGSAGAIAYSVKKIKESDSEEKTAPLMGVMGAFVFAAQMVNFAIPGTGSSGHIGGGILLAAVLGPFPAFLTLSVVLLIQALFFADGGLIALGCNIFNMGVIPCFLIYPLIFQPIIKRGHTTKNFFLASVISSTVNLEAGAFCVVVETLLSGITALPFREFLLLMLPIHLPIGFVEGIITASVLIYVFKVRPEILHFLKKEEQPNKVPLRLILASFSIVTILTAGFFSLHASTNPDGLEWSIAQITDSTEFNEEDSLPNKSAEIQHQHSVLPDYNFKGGKTLGNINGTTVAGFLGSGLVFVIAGVSGWLISKLKKRKRESNIE